MRCRHSDNKIIYGITLLTIFLFSDCIAIAHDIVIKIKAIAFDIRFSEWLNLKKAPSRRYISYEYIPISDIT